MNMQIESMKKRYEAPTLLVHGKVAELTAAGGTGCAENGGAKRPNTGNGGMGGTCG